MTLRKKIRSYIELGVSDIEEFSDLEMNGLLALLLAEKEYQDAWDFIDRGTIYFEQFISDLLEQEIDRKTAEMIEDKAHGIR